MKSGIILGVFLSIIAASPAAAFSFYGPGSGVNYTGFVYDTEGVGFSWPWGFLDQSRSASVQPFVLAQAFPGLQQNQVSFASANPSLNLSSNITTSPYIPSAQQTITMYQAPRQLISPLNHKPSFISIQPQTVRVGQAIQFTVQAYDHDGPYLRLSATDLPQGAVFNEHTRQFYWAPNAFQMGRYTVRFRVSDSRADFVEMPVSIAVTDERGFLPYTACGAGPGPYVYDFRPPLNVKAGELYVYQVRGSSGNNNEISYRVVEGPANFTIDEKTGYITWLVAYNQAGASYPVRIAIYNGQCEMSYNFTVVVR